ncbi:MULTISPECIES: thioredoxin family protein [unclassified Bosea (in: a-proteobacteria)]|uniref:thioredoxin family protein n=1 Tax=unclassified Bosea (in: a-proteobacteria) TaxID=2653178 RepID=UPI0009541B4F|nr:MULTISPECIES: thioredoxin family protein [unclassified Bosea (in: a-proteobacteria)]TAJ33519.1 MAG: thioredoxin family protein [Bosea sp. (in: a-proteobacteria)]SIQ93417.1 Peroxiredoxin [Bosea sp. TND4EK4]
MTGLSRQCFIIGAAFAGLSLATGSASAQATARIGQPAPAFQAVDAEGRTRSLSEFAGKTVVLEWTNHDCPYVRKHYNSATMQTLQKDMAKDGVVWLSVISSPPGEQGHVEAAKARELTAQRNAAPTAVLLDPRSAMARAYGAQTTPHMYVIDGKGTLAYMGAIDDKPSAAASSLDGARSYVRQAVAELKAGKPVSQASTKAYGCAVKYAPAS